MKLKFVILSLLSLVIVLVLSCAEPGRLCALMIILATSCEKDCYQDVHRSYEGQINDYSKLGEAERRMEDIAEHWGLTVVKVGRDEYLYPTPEGVPSLAMRFYLHEEDILIEDRALNGGPVLGISNDGLGYRLKLAVFDRWKMLISDLERLTQDVLTELGELGIKMYPVDDAYYVNESGEVRLDRPWSDYKPPER